MKMAVIAMLLCVLPMTCSAESLQDRIGTDKCAYFAISYVINDQLHRNTKLSALERFGEPKIDITEVREYGTGNTVGYKASIGIEKVRDSE